jgi:hypothetical protein
MTVAVETTEFEALVAAIENSPIVAPDLSATALAQVRDGVITGEGPTTRGRIHHSRTLDAADAAYCTRILMAAGGAEGAPVSRAEADMLMAIDAAAAERDAAGAFDDLFVKAVTHYVLSAAGRPVPPRPVALAADTPLSSWAETGHDDIDIEILDWIVSHVRGARRASRALMSLATLLAGTAVPFAQSLASLVYFSA